MGDAADDLEWFQYKQHKTEVAVADGTFPWETSEGETVMVKDMSNSHLTNALNLLTSKDLGDSHEARAMRKELSRRIAKNA